MSYNISGEKAAIQVSKLYEIPIVYRKHPRHQLLVSFASSKKEFELGDEVTIIISITNVGKNTICFQKNGFAENQYKFYARNRSKYLEGVARNWTCCVRSLEKKILLPGHVFEDKISLQKWFTFVETGLYLIHGSFFLEFIDPHDTSSKPSWERILWEDYVSADFTVRIK